MGKKPHILHKDGFEFHFSYEGKGRPTDVRCLAFEQKKEKGPKGKVLYETEPCLDWMFPKVPGNNIFGNAAIYLDQAVMYAKNPPDKPLPKADLSAEERLKVAEARIVELEKGAVNLLLSEAKLKKFEYNALDGKFQANVIVQSPFFSVLAEWLRKDFETTGATNYLEQTMTLNTKDGPSFVVTIQKLGGKTPGEINRELQQENGDLRQETYRLRKIIDEMDEDLK